MAKLEMEMEESEALVSGKPKQTSTIARKTTTAKGSYCGRYSCLLLFIGIVLGVIFTSDIEALKFWEGEGGENVDDVDQKEIKPPTIEPTAQPTPQPTPDPTPTPPLTPEPTPNPTPQPTDDPTPQPTPKPTEAAATPDPTPDLTPQPTEAAAADATPQPTEAAASDATPQPTEATPDSNNEKPAEEKKADMKETTEGVSDIIKYPKPDFIVRPDPPVSQEKADALAKEWGKWEFVDTKAAERPTEDYCGEYPNRDIPHDKFPEHAWQTDAEYLEKWLDQSIKLVERAMEAILAEYGRGTKDMPDKDFAERSKMFELELWDFQSNPDRLPNKAGTGNAGWTTEKSKKGLTRRLLHTIVTGDQYNFIMGGHSAAAGHGNMFKQSYTMQFHKVMEPIFSFLGVKLESHNFGRGGLGTIQDALGFMDAYGDSVDFMIWDSGMTEGRDRTAVHLFYRMAILSGTKVPFIVGDGVAGELIYYNTHCDADIASIEFQSNFITECTNFDQCEKEPYAARYLKCNSETKQLCTDNKFLANCWVDRPDVTPPKAQKAAPGSQVSWHPGFRSHQITGRTMSFVILNALKEALLTWQQAEKYVLPDDAWHMAGYYENIRKKFADMDDTDNPCLKGMENLKLPTRICSTPMHLRTEFTPRLNPELTSIMTIMKPTDDGYLPQQLSENIYTGPDVHNPLLDLPEGAIDVLSIVSNGRTYPDERRQLMDVSGSARYPQLNGNEMEGRRLQDIVPGHGVGQILVPPGYCDGSWNTECRRDDTNDCLLNGHSDSRGGLIFDGYSGGIVMTLPAVKEGLILIKLETWHFPGDSFLTEGWTSIDNKGRRLLRGVANATLDERHLKPKPPETCDEFQFEFSIDGKKTTWNKNEWDEVNIISAQRVVELAKLLDDPNYTNGEPKDVELAFHMLGCHDSTKKSMSLTHVYWA